MVSAVSRRSVHPPTWIVWASSRKGLAEQFGWEGHAGTRGLGGVMLRAVCDIVLLSLVCFGCHGDILRSLGDIAGVSRRALSAMLCTEL